MLNSTVSPCFFLRAILFSPFATPLPHFLTIPQFLLPFTFPTRHPNRTNPTYTYAKCLTSAAILSTFPKTKSTPPIRLKRHNLPRWREKPHAKLFLRFSRPTPSLQWPGVAPWKCTPLPPNDAHRFSPGLAARTSAACREKRGPCWSATFSIKTASDARDNGINGFRT